MNWYLDVLKKYAVFEGRARRKEYWMFILFNLLIAIGLSIIDGVSGLINTTGFSPLETLYALAVFLPGLAVFVRRMHDINRSGWSILFAFIPIVGAIMLLVWLVREGVQGDNQYGHDPKARETGGYERDDRFQRDDRFERDDRYQRDDRFERK